MSATEATATAAADLDVGVVAGPTEPALAATPASPAAPAAALPGTPGIPVPVPVPSGVLASPTIRRTVTTRRRENLGAMAAVGGVVLFGAVIAVTAAHTRSLLPETIRFIPPSLAGAFGSLFVNLHVGGAIAVLVLMFASYAAAVALSGQLSARVVLTAIVVVHLLVLLGPPLASTDVFSYQAYARMGASYGVNPYTHAPYAINLDPVFPYIGAKWSTITPSAYGPVFTVATYLLAPLSIATSVFAYKGIAALASLALVAVVWRCARLRGVDPVKAAALVGLNPLLVIYGVGGGHNDLLMLLAMVGGVYAVLASREWVGGGLSLLAIGIKLTAGLVLPFALADGGAAGRLKGGRVRLALGAGVGLAALVALSIGVFGAGSVHMLGAVVRSQREGGWLGIPGFISSKLGMPAVSHIAGFVLAGAFAVTLCWLLRRVWRGQMDWIAGAGWAMLAMLVASSSLLPWYVAWLLPLAALGRDRRLITTAIVFTGVVQGITLLGYIPHGFL
jgi:alpha-1,6-mannosyltransferase